MNFSFNDQMSKQNSVAKEHADTKKVSQFYNIKNTDPTIVASPVLKNLNDKI